jgi:hypothetical protein
VTNRADPHFLATFQKSETNPGWVVALSAQQHHIGDMDGCLSFDDAGLPHLPDGSHMPLNHIDALDDYPLILGVGKAYFAFLPSVLAGNYQYGIILSDFHSYKTSGANDIILVNSFSLSSRATGPKMRVPLGLFRSVIITAAFSSNLM